MEHSNWNCPKCHHQNISGTLIQCPKCGKKRNRWGYWDCPYCGSHQIRGDHKECPNCGKPKDREIKFYLNDNCPIEFVDEVSGESAVRIGKQNWICPFCSQQNDDSVQNCVYCGSPRSESRERYHDVPSAENQLIRVVPPSKRSSKGCWLGLIIGLCAFLLPVFIIIGVELSHALGDKITHKAELQTAAWESNIYVEELKTIQESDWELPPDVRLLRTAEEEHEYIDHYEQRSRQVWEPDNNDGGGWDGGGWDGGGDGGGWADYGNGQFGMLNLPLLTAKPAIPLAAFRYRTEYYDEPVYATRMDTKYYYEYEAWVETRKVTLHGKDHTEPVYGSLDLAANERERERSITYYLTFQYKSRTEKVPCSKEEYDAFLDSGVVRFHYIRSEEPHRYEFVLDE